MYENFPKRQSIKGDVREYGKTKWRKYVGKIARRSTRNKIRSHG